MAAVLILFLAPLLPRFLAPVNAYHRDFTHAVYVESITATFCSACRVDQGLILQASEKYSGSLHFVEFHVSDEWNTRYGMEKAREYGTTLVPTHAYDAGYSIEAGTVNEEKIESTGKRPVHKVTLAIAKSVQGSTLSFKGSIKEEDGETFRGKIIIVAVENGLRSAGLTWNSVFRDCLFSHDVTVAASTYTFFSGMWEIPGGVIAGNVQLVMAAFDSADRSSGESFAAQSVSDMDSGAVIPEFSMALTVAGTAIAAVLIILRASRPMIEDHSKSRWERI